MAKILQQHWGDVFTSRGVNEELLQQWVREDEQDMVDTDTQQRVMSLVNLKRSHVKKTLERSNNSAPGPDGIPYAAWRTMKDMAADILFAALMKMITENGALLTSRHYPDFNSSHLMFFAKETCGCD